MWSLLSILCIGFGIQVLLEHRSIHLQSLSILCIGFMSNAFWTVMDTFTFQFFVLDSIDMRQRATWIGVRNFQFFVLDSRGALKEQYWAECDILPFNSLYWILDITYSPSMSQYRMTFNSLYWILANSGKPLPWRVEQLSILCIGFPTTDVRNKLILSFISWTFNSLYWIHRGEIFWGEKRGETFNSLYWIH